jgi:hypothetical protein
MARPYMKNTVAELEGFLKKHAADRAVLGELRAELTNRTTPRAKQLLREVNGLLTGSVAPPPKGMKAPNPDDQGALFSPKGKKD